MVILSDEEEQAKANNNVSTSASPVTMKQISQLLVDGQEKVLATVQNMIDKSLGKQPLANDSSASMSSVAGTFQNHSIPPESSAIPAPQYGMPMNFYDGQKPPEQYNVNGTVRPISVDRFQLVRPVTRPVRPVLVPWWRISRLLNRLLVCLLFRLILAEQMDLLVIVFLHTPL